MALRWQYSGVVINTLPDCEKVLGLNPSGDRGLSAWISHVLPVFVWVLSGYMLL